MSFKKRKKKQERTSNTKKVVNEEVVLKATKDRSLKRNHECPGIWYIKRIGMKKWKGNIESKLKGDKQ